MEISLVFKVLIGLIAVLGSFVIGFRTFSKNNATLKDRSSAIVKINCLILGSLIFIFSKEISNFISPFLLWLATNLEYDQFWLLFIIMIVVFVLLCLRLSRKTEK